MQKQLAGQTGQYFKDLITGEYIQAGSGILEYRLKVNGAGPLLAGKNQYSKFYLNFNFTIGIKQYTKKLF